MENQQLLKFYVKFLQIIGENKTKEFQDLRSDKERIDFMYKFNIEEPLVIIPSLKSYDEALELKAHGNILYLNKQFQDAISAYTKGLKRCPFDTRKFAENF